MKWWRDGVKCFDQVNFGINFANFYSMVGEPHACCFFSYNGDLKKMLLINVRHFLFNMALSSLSVQYACGPLRRDSIETALQAQSVRSFVLFIHRHAFSKLILKTVTVFTLATVPLSVHLTCL